jgi:hypothetical protein
MCALSIYKALGSCPTDVVKGWGFFKMERIKEAATCGARFFYRGIMTIVMTISYKLWKSSV